MGEERTYGLILPPGYDKNTQQRYPVIVLYMADMVSEDQMQVGTIGTNTCMMR